MSTMTPRKREHDDEVKDIANAEKKMKQDDTVLPTANELTDEQVIKMAQEYVKWEPEQSARDTVTSWLTSNNIKSIRDAFLPRIAFGTAGLRARMAPGYHFMNQLVVIQTTQGLCRYLQQQNPTCTSQGIILGYDGRYNSRTYAHLVASIFLSQNIPVYLYKEMTATPFVPFGVLEYKAAAGVMITASHNPKEDNGYKLYWSNGCQIIPPHDRGIADLILANLEPWDTPTFDPNHSLLKNPSEHCYAKYFAESAKRYSWISPDINRASKLRVTYTAMHGVGAPFTAKALAAFSLPPYIPVTQQVEADPEFPTVKFPNPEEGKGALALSIETANRENSTLILANDPDADRLAIAEKQSSGEWRIFTGNEIALLFAGWTWQNYIKQHPDADKSKACMIASTVSSKAIEAMAKKEGFTFVDTLTGFKWMGNAASDMLSRGYTFLFAFEVEIGFLVGNLSLDKDGIRTAAIFNEMANQLLLQGKTCAQHLDELYQKYGYFVMNTSYFFCDQAPKMNAIFTRLRTMNNGTYPDRCGEYQIVSVRDCTIGYDSAQPGNVSLLPKAPESQMITFRFANGSTCTLRNSGTEPKLKYYVECTAPTESAASQLTSDMTRVIIDEFVQPHVHGLAGQGQTK